MRCLVFAMVLPGFSPLGQTLAQFMICLHRYSLKGSSRSFSLSAVNSSRLSMIHLQAMKHLQAPDLACHSIGRLLGKSQPQSLG